ncbi:P44-1 outer membrane protein [Anaplasma phagocytophilum str. MRK]|nr:P44-1 outer membrane protein [Anaplasma phagocytophilum str. MRK]
MEISNPNIDKKVCSGSHAVGKTGGDNNSGVTGYAYTSSGNTKTAQCNGLGSGAATSEKGLNKFVNETKVGEDKNWPTGHITGNSRLDTEGETNGNAREVAKDLTKLTHDEKTIVAGLLAKTIEGGEVVEIRAVSSTSVMVNACYDLLSEGLGVVPYACVGLGGNFVGVVDGHITNHSLSAPV